MNRNSCRIGLQHEFAATFFKEAMQPDLAELHRRDMFLEKIRQEIPSRIEGTDIVAEIPDIDIAALLCPPAAYCVSKDQAYEFSLVLPVESKIKVGSSVRVQGGEHYSYIVTGDVIAA